jgi:hypothetical protein
LSHTVWVQTLPSLQAESVVQPQPAVVVWLQTLPLQVSTVQLAPSLQSASEIQAQPLVSMLQ